MYVRKLIQSGCVQECMTFCAREGTNPRTAREPQPRFEDEAEREYHRTAISRRKHARLANANWSPECIHSVLTFAEEPADLKDARRMRDNFKRRIKRKYPDSTVWLYVGPGRKSGRLHCHMISKGIPKEEIEVLWGYGLVPSCEHLREHNYYNGVDFGQDYTNLANYLFHHGVSEDLGTHRWTNTRNIRRPIEEQEELKPESRDQIQSEIPDGYMLVESKNYAYGNYKKYVLDPSEGNSKSRSRFAKSESAITDWLPQ